MAGHPEQFWAASGHFERLHFSGQGWPIQPYAKGKIAFLASKALTGEGKSAIEKVSEAVTNHQLPTWQIKFG